MFRSLILLFAFAALAIAASPATAAKRIALVIGNNTYQNVPELAKAINDARAVKSALTTLGFKVAIGEDQTRKEMARSIAEVEQSLGEGDEVFFFYAGHGVAVGNENYLIPVDIPALHAGEEQSVADNAIGATSIVSRFQKRGARVVLVVLDACRDNPFEVSGTRALGGSARGLKKVEAPSGVFVLFSAGIGQTALDRLGEDDDNPNSVFTRNLVPLLKTKGLTHVQLAKRVQSSVIDLAATVGQKQEPAYYDQIKGEIVLSQPLENDGAVADEPVVAEVKAAVAKPIEVAALEEKPADAPADVKVKTRGENFTGGKSNIIKAWKSVEASGDPAALLAFIETFGTDNPQFAKLATRKLKVLQGNSAPAKPAEEADVASVPDETPTDDGEPADAAGAIVAAVEPPQAEEVEGPVRTAKVGGNAEATECDSLAASPADGSALAQGVAMNSIDTGKAIAACQAALGRTPENGRLAFQLGRALEASGAVKDAAAAYQQAADQGFALAYNNLAGFYESGQGVARDPAKAISLYAKAAELGNADAMNVLGKSYASGHGTAQDFGKAAEYWQLASDKGNTFAMANLGMLYANGQGVAVDLGKAEKLWRTAAEGGDSLAMFQLGYLIASGHAESKDIADGAHWMVAALEHHSAFALDQMTTGWASFSEDFRRAFAAELKAKGVYEGEVDGEISDLVIAGMKKLAGEQE